MHATCSSVHGLGQHFQRGALRRERRGKDRVLPPPPPSTSSFSGLKSINLRGLYTSSNPPSLTRRSAGKQKHKQQPKSPIDYTSLHIARRDEMPQRRRESSYRTLVGMCECRQREMRTTATSTQASRGQIDPPPLPPTLFTCSSMSA